MEHGEADSLVRDALLRVLRHFQRGQNPALARAADEYERMLAEPPPLRLAEDREPPPSAGPR